MKIEVCKGREEAQQVVDGLNAYNKQQLDWFLKDIYTPIQLVAKNDEGKIVGGILGGVGYYAGFYIRIFWIDENERGKGLGTKMLKMAEEKAKENGATMVTLDTFSFQAETFYIKMGYDEIGRINDYPKEGEAHVFFKKELK